MAALALADAFRSLLDSLYAIDNVLAIGKSGGESLPAPNDGDIDLFIFCRQIPTAKERLEALRALGGGITGVKVSEKKGNFWGFCDFACVHGIDLCCMYFTAAEMNDELDCILRGDRLERESESFYPTGRCASILSMHIFLDRVSYLAGLKSRLSVYPKALAEAMVRHHIQEIRGEYGGEDFERALARENVLFYHATLENALDHYLQALFAYNHCFFPSRKRTLQFIDGFAYKPADCAGRLLRTIALGASPDTLTLFYEVWINLCEDLLDIVG